jgi:hypothetical protein
MSRDVILCSVVPYVENVLRIACFLSVVFYTINVLFVPDFKTTTSLSYIPSRTTAAFQSINPTFIISIRMTTIILPLHWMLSYCIVGLVSNVYTLICCVVPPHDANL